MDETLDSIENQAGNKKVIITDGGSNDKTLEIAPKRRCEIIPSIPGSGPQLNRGADQAEGDFLVFLHADTTLPKGASTGVVSLMKIPQTIAGSFSLALKPSSKLLEFYSLCTFLNNLYFTFGDQRLSCLDPHSTC